MLDDYEINKYLESTLLRADALSKEIESLCLEAVQCGFRGVCVNPFYLPMAASMLQGSSVVLVTVVGFPLGASGRYVKALEAENAVKNGAGEIDMVINVGALKNGHRAVLKGEISAVVELGVPVKVIIETGLLTEVEFLLACECVVEAGAHFVKTSTGFGPRGATVEDIRLLRAHLPPQTGIKASGGIKTAAQAKELISAGASLIGSSCAEKIYREGMLKL